MEVDYIDDSISVSKYPLSASVALSKIINAFEDVWKVE
jgi:rRNA pseudouridine-1189 N-methylase Emg1 (Nep1/Mra1 family)